MDRDKLPPKSWPLNLIVNRDSVYRVLRIFFMVIIYAMMILLVIVKNYKTPILDAVLGAASSIYWEDNTSYVVDFIKHLPDPMWPDIVLACVSIICYCISTFLINKYVKACKGKDVSDGVLEKLKDERDDIEGDIKIMLLFISGILGVFSNNYTCIPKEEIITFSAVSSFFILSIFAYPDKNFHDKLVKCIEHEKDEAKYNKIINGITKKKATKKK